VLIGLKRAALYGNTVGSHHRQRLIQRVYGKSQRDSFSHFRGLMRPFNKLYLGLSFAKEDYLSSFSGKAALNRQPHHYVVEVDRPFKVIGTNCGPYILHWLTLL